MEQRDTNDFGQNSMRLALKSPAYSPKASAKCLESLGAPNENHHHYLFLCHPMLHSPLTFFKKNGHQPITKLSGSESPKIVVQQIQNIHEIFRMTSYVFSIKHQLHILTSKRKGLCSQPQRKPAPGRAHPPKSAPSLRWLRLLRSRRYCSAPQRVTKALSDLSGWGR